MAEREEETEASETVSECKETVEKFNLDHVVADFARICAVDPSSQLHKLEALVDELLARSEECCTITDQIRGESKNLLFTSMPEFYKRCKEMEQIFKQIDSLEKFITAIKNNVDEMDEKVQLAEKQLGNKNLKKILNSIPIPQYFAQKKQVKSYLKPEIKEGEFCTPAIFKVEDFIISTGETRLDSKELDASNLGT